VIVSERYLLSKSAGDR